jgi:hypothetical protein
MRFSNGPVTAFRCDLHSSEARTGRCLGKVRFLPDKGGRLRWREAFLPSRNARPIPMSLRLVMAEVILLFVISVLVAVIVSTVRERYLRPLWKRRFSIDSAYDRALAAREAEWIDGPERREALRWRAHWIASEIGDYGEETDDAELRLFARLVIEAALFIDPKVGGPRRRLDRLRDLLDFVRPYLPKEERWWRSQEFNHKYALVAHYEEVAMRRDASGGGPSAN